VQLKSLSLAKCGNIHKPTLNWPVHLLMPLTGIPFCRARAAGQGQQNRGARGTMAPPILALGGFFCTLCTTFGSMQVLQPPNLILLPPPLLQGDCIDERWDKWSNHCTLPKRRKLPWVNSSIRWAISKRNNYWERSRQNPSHREKYKQSRNKVLSMLCEGKRNLPNSSLLKPKTLLENYEAPEWQDLNIHPSLSRTMYS